MGFVTRSNDFNKLRDKLQANAKSRGKFSDDRLVKMSIGNTYKVRLLYYLEEGTKLNEPFIRKYTHTAQDVDERWKTITCPTTFHGKKGFDMCPVCENNSKLWNSGVDADKELYKKFRRRFSGYAIVYVQHDPSTPENNGKVKLMKFGVKIDKFLQKEIFGIAEDANDDILDVVGFDAFKLVEGYDLIVTVEDQGGWPDYECKFARNASSVKVDEADLEKQIKELNFEAEYREDDDPALKKFYSACILQSDDEDTASSINVDGDTVEVDDDSDDSSEDEDDDLKDLIEELNDDEDSEEDEDEDEAEDEDEDDIDALLSELD